MINRGSASALKLNPYAKQTYPEVFFFMLQGILRSSTTAQHQCGLIGGQTRRKKCLNTLAGGGR